MRRLLYCLLGSTLFHVALLWMPIPMSAGDARENALQPVRVQLLEVPGTDARKPVSIRSGQPEKPRKARQANAREPRAKTKQAPPAPPSRTRVVEPPPATKKPVGPAPAPMQRVATDPRRQTRPEPAKPPRPAAVAKPAGNVPPASASAPARKRRGEGEGNSKAASEVTRAVAPKPSAGEGVKARAGFTPVRYARTVKPRYPGKARRAGWEGTTVLKVLVDPEGAPGRVTVDRPSGFDILDAAAVKAVRRWKFHPARSGVDPVPSWVRIPVAFKLKEDQR